MSERQMKMKEAIERVKYIMAMSYEKMARYESVRSGKKISKQGMHTRIRKMIEEERVEEFKAFLGSLGLNEQQIERLIGE